MASRWVELSALQQATIKACVYISLKKIILQYDDIPRPAANHAPSKDIHACLRLESNLVEKKNRNITNGIVTTPKRAVDHECVQSTVDFGTSRTYPAYRLIEQPLAIASLVNHHPMSSTSRAERVQVKFYAPTNELGRRSTPGFAG